MTTPSALSAVDPYRASMATETARMLLDVQAVLFMDKEPFIFTSGWASPVYIDCRKLISFPRVRRRLMGFAAELLEREVGPEGLDVIAGGETAGIPFAAWLADRQMLPMVYVRKKPKGFGRNAQIEGMLAPGQRTLLVEDLTTDGRSKVAFCEALREAGASVAHAFSLFHYGIFPSSKDSLDAIGVTLHALATWWDVLTAARESGYFAAATLTEVEAFLTDPIGWSAAHGGAGSLD